MILQPPGQEPDWAFRDGKWVRVDENGDETPRLFQTPDPQVLQAEREPASDEKYLSLRVADRCDYCGSQAYVRVVTPRGELLLCAHDYAKHEPAILMAGHEVLDERHKIPKGGPAL